MSPEQREKMVEAVAVAICRDWGFIGGVPPSATRYARQLAEAAVDALGIEQINAEHCWDADGVATGESPVFRVGVLGDTDQ